MDAELGEVKRELSKLKGLTILTHPQRKPNAILDVDPEKGVLRKALDKKNGEPKWVRWTSILRGYAHLRKKGQADNRSGGYLFGGDAQFVMPLLAELTTVEIISDKRPRMLRYIPEVLPPRLKRNL